MASEEPVERAMWGMSPWLWFWGIARAGAALVWQALMTTPGYCRRHFPAWITSV